MTQLETAIELCKLLESLSEETNAHPALSGGTLYKEGERKDIDIVLFLHNLPENHKVLPYINDITGVYFDKIEGLSFSKQCTERVVKGTYKGYDIDFIYPESGCYAYPNDLVGDIDDLVHTSGGDYNHHYFPSHQSW